MLVAFFKKQEDIKCECEIVKFVDRLWIEGSHDLLCIRTFIVKVKEESVPLTELRMLVPFRQTPELVDLSESCLDENYRFNKFSTGGYEIKSTDPVGNCGRISYDYFDVTVYKDNQIKAYDAQEEGRKIISINFKGNPVKPGEYRLIRYKFKVTSILDEVFKNVYNLKLLYFHSHDKEDSKKLDIENLEVPVCRIVDESKKMGGIDVILYLSNNMQGTNINSTSQSTSYNLPDGTISAKIMQQFVWRARLLFGPDVNYLKYGLHLFSVEGLISNPNTMETIRDEIRISKYFSWAAFGLSVIAFFFSIELWGAIIRFLKSLSE